MMDYIDLLFHEWNDNFPESIESDRAVQLLCNDGFEDSPTQSRRQDILIMAISAEKRNAFRGGFACMLRLMQESYGRLSEKS